MITDESVCVDADSIALAAARDIASMEGMCRSQVVSKIQCRILQAMTRMLRGNGSPAAYLHTVVQDDGTEDIALSFSPDSFPLQGVGGFRSIRCEPLYASPVDTPATP